jgi:hypothetical protein
LLQEGQVKLSPNHVIPSAQCNFTQYKWVQGVQAAVAIGYRI